MFHVVYSRHYWDTEDQGTFESVQTLYRNVPYSQIGFMNGKCAELKEKADKDYADYESKQEHKSDPDQFYKSEVYTIDDEDYFKTYKDVYPDVYSGPSGLIPEQEDYYHDYGQKNNFMLVHDDDENYTWYGKDWTQEQIAAEYKKREEERISA
jgi:hypothetical protein|tara:strand:- start:19 stop:477 length:459 start_codon:yes stop_codon:yes gene_type:complete